MNWRDKAASAVEKRGHPGTDKTDKRAFVSNVSAHPTPFLADEPYTIQDLQDFDRLLRELAECEDWPEDELQAALADRKRMAPVAVPGALQRLRKAHRESVGQWPDTPTTRTQINLLETA